MSEGRTVNRQRVAWSLRRYRWAVYLVVAANTFLVYLLFLFFLRAALPSFLLAVAVLVCVFLFARGRLPAHLNEKDSCVRPIDTARYGWVTELWRARCASYGMEPGPIFVVKTGEEAIDARFATENWSMEQRHPVLYVGELCLPLFRPEIVEPMIEHELGHHRLMGLVMKRFFGYVSIPVTYLLSLFSVQRQHFERIASNATMPCWFLERFLFWGSCRAFQQYEEYAADALMAEALGDEDQSVGALEATHRHLISLGLQPLSSQNAHLGNHPTLERRVKAIRKLFD